ncbi:MAG: flagellar brake protein [Planctomycetes bacterium]|nr:flagellar brake protein [Planctomycetota bacterium]
MAKANAITGKAMTSLLDDAVARGLSLDFVRLLPTGHDACRSRFVEVPKMAVAVEVPSRMGHPVPVRPGEAIEIRFHLRDKHYHFRSSVTRRAKVSVTDRLDMSVLELVPPKSVHPLQRRRHARVTVDASQRLMAHLWLVDEQHEDVAAQMPPAEILDLSGGGMRVIVEGPLRGRFKEGRSLHVHVDLADGRAPLQIRAHVEHVDRSISHQARLGVHFEGLDDSPQGRAAMDRLVRFVARRERDELQRMKKQR